MKKLILFGITKALFRGGRKGLLLKGAKMGIATFLLLRKRNEAKNYFK